MNREDFSRNENLQVIEEVSLTNVGLKRKNNEDAVGDPSLMAPLIPAISTLLPTRGRLYAVADGMGGLEKGEEASQLALETFYKTYYSSRGHYLEDLERAVKSANEAVFQLGSRYLTQINSKSPDNEESVRSKMGTTLVAALIYGPKVTICNIGDSRAYLFRGGWHQHLSKDHSLVAEGVEMGLFTPEQAKHSPLKNIVTRAMGQKAEVKADFFELQLVKGDVILLCSDGLYGRVEDRLIVQILAGNSLKEAGQALIEEANNSGGPDNISVVMVKVA